MQRWERTPPEQRIWNYVDKSQDCWEWQGGKVYGYGRFGIRIEGKAKTLVAHRYIYELTHGVLPKEFDLDHMCRNRGCVNPAHLKPCTRKENLHAPGSLSLAKVYKERSHCANGHEYTKENTYMRSSGARECRQCGAERANKYYHKKVGR